MTPATKEYRAACKAWSRDPADDINVTVHVGERLYLAALARIVELETLAERVALTGDAEAVKLAEGCS